MTIQQALSQVETRLAQIERKNSDGILRPWEPDACADAREHWGLTQKKIALQSGKPHGRQCCADLHLDPPERTEPQKRAAKGFQKAA